MINALIEAYRLKDEVRTGWTLRGVRDPESVADHSWGTAYLVLLYADEAEVDRARALEIALVHDLAEAKTGDVATRVAAMRDPRRVEEKARRERGAMDELMEAYTPQRASRVRGLWEEYEATATPEAVLVREMNLIDMCLQAYVYEESERYDPDAPNDHFPDYRGLDEFFATTAPRLRTPVGERLFREIAEAYARLPRVAARGGLHLEP
ncbi:MAG: HD domain-containing protein [Spirochaetota bacterium]